MAVGDVQSEERGSGARYNDDKARLDLIPVELHRDMLYRRSGSDRLWHMLDSVAVWQKFADDDWSEQFLVDALHQLDVLAAEGGEVLVDEIASVFEYGLRKYESFNWAKGMDYSVALGSLLRHCRNLVVHEQHKNDESGLSEFGHIGCNLVMLIHFTRYFPDLDDRPHVLSMAYHDLSMAYHDETVDVVDDENYALGA